MESNREQAGAELPDLPVVVFHLNSNLGPLPFAKNINRLLFDNKFAKNINFLLFDNKLRMSSNKLRSYFIFQKLRLAFI